MFRLSLYPDPILPTIQPANVWNPFAENLLFAFSAAWLETFDGYHYGAMTAYMLRAYGYPNIPGGDPFKHSHCWGIATDGGHVLKIECRPLVLSRYRSSPAKDRGMMVRELAESGTFKIIPVAMRPETINAEWVANMIQSFRDPIYVGDLGADAVGLVPPERDVGPGSHAVRRAGAASINLIVPPPVVDPSQEGMLRIADGLTTRMSV